MRIGLKRAAVLCAAAVFISSFPQCGYAAEKTITRDYYFESETEDLTYTPEEIIEADGKQYIAKDVKIELFSEPVTEKKKIKNRSKQTETEITKTVNGQTITLYAPSTRIDWKDNREVITKEYASEDEAEEEITEEGKTFKLRSIEQASRIDPVSTAVTFTTSDPSSSYYRFNGKEVKLIGSEPVWDGYKKDIASYLGISGRKDYSVNGMKWSGDFIKKGSEYTRTAYISGSKTVNYVKAVYGLSDADTVYTAEVTYKSKYIGHATVSYERHITLKQKIIYAGTGALVLSLAASALLYFLRRKKNDEAEEI